MPSVFLFAILNNYCYVAKTLIFGFSETMNIIIFLIL